MSYLILESSYTRVAEMEDIKALSVEAICIKLMKDANVDSASVEQLRGEGWLPTKIS